MWTNLRHAIRILRRSPMFTAVAVLSLGLGIGANTAIFSLADQVLLRMLPIKDPQRLVVFHGQDSQPGWSSSDSDETVFSYPLYKDLRDRAAQGQMFDGMVARSGSPVNVAHGGETERASAEIVSGNFFQVLGVKAKLGRLITPEDDANPGAHPVVVLTESYWKRRFGGSQEILNQTLQLNGHPMVVIGVAETAFRGVLQAQTPDVLVPMAMKRQITPDWDGLVERRIMWLNIFARLRPGQTLSQVEPALAAIYRPILEEELAQMNRGDQKFRERFLSQKLELKDASQGINALSKDWRNPLVALLGMTGLVLLIACANIANLLLARAAGRAKEIAIRLAMGASRAAVVRQLLTESLVLSVAGGLLGLLLSSWITAALIGALPTDAIGGWLQPRVDLRLLGFNLALSLLTGVIFGLVPALQSASPDLTPTLKDQSAGGGSARSHTRLRHVLVAGQVALSLLLLVGAGLFARSLYNLALFDPGFRAEGLLTFAVDPKLSGYTKERGLAFYQQLLERLEAMPGVRHVAATNIGPLTNSSRNSNVTVEGYQAREEEDLHVSVNAITPGYFQTLGTPLLEGREFNARDNDKGQKVVVVNEAFARHFFGDRSPIGRHMAVGGGSSIKLDLEIVGVVSTSKHLNLREKPRRFFYLPLAQTDRLDRMNFYVRTPGDPEAASIQVRRVVSEMDAKLPIFNVKSMPGVLREAIYGDRILAMLACAFGLLATLMAALGLYGVLAYNVARRTREIGVRIALGAARGDVTALVMKEVGLLLAAGLVIGLPLAFVLGRLIETLLFDLKAADLLVFSAAVTSLAATAILAGYLPARRAARIDPIHALRYE